MTIMLVETASRVDHTFSVQVASGNPIVESVIHPVVKHKKPANSERIHAALLEEFDLNNELGVYFRQIDGIPLLTREEEVRLATQMETGRAARDTLIQWRVSHPDNVIEDDADMTHVVQIAALGLEAEKKLVESNLRLVTDVAKDYLSRGVPYIELIKEGNIGLIRAAKKYDLSRGTVFSTYATWWIRKTVGDAAANLAGDIRTPKYLIPEVAQYKRLLEEFYQKNHGLDPTEEQMAVSWIYEDFMKNREGSVPTEAEITEALPSAIKKIQLLDRIYIQRTTVSIEGVTDALDNPDGNTHFGLAVDQNPLPEDQVILIDRFERLEQQMKTLSSRDAEIMRLHFEEGKTYEEIGKIYSVSKMSVGNWIKKIVHRLKQFEESGVPLADQKKSMHTREKKVKNKQKKRNDTQKEKELPYYKQHKKNHLNTIYFPLLTKDFHS